jgi:NAD(P)-dependent dehydrogenase (short-subunit alcohol dehydrogenase family)
VRLLNLSVKFIRAAMRTVLITGASRGIGLGLVRGFLNTAGTRVIATARRPDSAVELAALLKAGAARHAELAVSSRMRIRFELLDPDPDPGGQK